MTIYGLDLSHWNGECDFAKIAQDPRKFRFVYSKAAHGTAKPGTPDGYPLDSYIAQTEGAFAVGMDIGAYHFWYDMDPVQQAACFYAACGDRPGNLPPCADIEDPAALAGARWTDTASANKALQYCLGLLERIHQYLTEIERLFGVKPIIYTGAWWLDTITELPALHYPDALLWLKEYDWFIADYYPPMDAPKHIGRVIIWQQTSTVEPGIDGIYSSPRVDLDVWLLTDAQYEEWAGGAIVTPPVVPPVVPPATGDIETRLAKAEADILALKEWQQNVRKA